MPRSQQRAPRHLHPGLVVLIAVVVACSGSAILYLVFAGGRSSARQIESLFTPPFGGRQQVDILVLGEDDSGEVRRSDTIIIAHLDLAQKRIAMVSVPRDFRVDMPGHGTQKVNAAFSLGGLDLTRATLERNLGIVLPYHVVITVSGLRRLVDAMGGVTINVDKRMHYRDRSQNLLIDLHPGVQRLNGRQAEGYVRFRHDALGDLKRIERQQRFLKAVAQQLLQKDNLLRLPALLQAFRKLVKTNLTVGDLQAVKQLAEEGAAQGLVAETLPGTPVNVKGVSYLEPDWPACREQIQHVFYGSKALVAVLNGTTVPGLAASVSQSLDEGGYTVETVANAPEQAERTQIIAYRKAESAYQIRKLLGYGEVIESPEQGAGGADITVILGRDAFVPRPAGAAPGAAPHGTEAPEPGGEHGVGTLQGY